MTTYSVSIVTTKSSPYEASTVNFKTSSGALSYIESLNESELIRVKVCKNYPDINSNIPGMMTSDIVFLKSSYDNMYINNLK